MLDALSAAGHESHLLSYAHGAAEPAPTSWTHHRLAAFPRLSSLRSGPSAGKIALDLQMVPRLRMLAEEIRPDRVIAHNVEAALVCRAAQIDAVYFAHTRFDAELPTYLPKRMRDLRGLMMRGGRTLDRIASSGRDLLAISPALGEHLGALYVPPPWEVSDPGDRNAARRVLGLRGSVALYAGNLDGYQGWETLVIAATKVPELTLAVATASSPAPLRAYARKHGAKVEVLGLRDERDRVLAHAAADFAVVPRRAEGGLPIKLLDALSRQLPVVAQERAAAGLRPHGTILVSNDDPEALAHAMRELAASRETAQALGQAGQRWIAQHHAPRIFAKAFEAALS